MIVVDANVLAYFWLSDPLSAAAEACYHKDRQWVVPWLWRSEFCNVLAHYLRRNLLDLPKAQAAYEKADRMLKKAEYALEVGEVLQLITQSNCSAYDCEYVALARRLGVKLVTKDAKLIKAFPALAVDLEIFVRT